MYFEAKAHRGMSGQWSAIIFFNGLPMYKSKGHMNAEQAKSNAMDEFAYHLRSAIGSAVKAEIEDDE